MHVWPYEGALVIPSTAFVGLPSHRSQVYPQVLTLPTPPQIDALGRGLLLGEPKLRALGVLRLRPPTLVVKGTSSSRCRGSSSLGEAIRQT